MTTSEQEAVSGRAGRGRVAEAEQAGDASASVEGPENISQIREILFGRHMEEYERHFSSIEDRITSVTSTIQAEFAERLADLEASIKRELKALAKDLRSEHEKRIAGVEQKLQAARSDLQTGVDTLREELSAHVKSFGEDLEREHDRVDEMVAREAADLRARKIDRTTLAALLNEVAARLESAEEYRAAPEER